MVSGRRTFLALAGAALANASIASGTQDDELTVPTSRTESDAFGDPPAFPEPDPVTDPDIATDRLARQVRGNVAFSLALLEQLGDDAPGTNRFFSPYSISVALAMTYAGARGETAEEMADALRYELEGDDLHAAFDAFEDEFDRRSDDGDDADDASRRRREGSADEKADVDFQLSSANAVWTDATYPFDETYLALLENYYNAGDHSVDFRRQPEAARQEINDWVATETNDRIEDILPEGAVDRSTRLVLTNAMYFLAAWEHEFDPARTDAGTFRNLDRSESTVDLMNQQARGLQYAEIDGHQLVELPYANGETSMVVILPAEGEFEAFEDALTVDRLATMLEDASYSAVDLTLPKFGVESKVSLVDVMESLGMKRAFTRNADFSGMVVGDDDELFVDDILHQSFVEVDEEGTEAAAATGTTISVTSSPQYTEMTVDRPFLFYIRDRPTEIPLFVGRVVDGDALN